MKKILICLATICCCACGNIETKDTYTTELPEIKYYINDASRHIYSVKIEGHIYLVYSGSYKGGIIHAEHCPCKDK